MTALCLTAISVILCALMNINIMSWNATGIISSSSYLCDTLLDQNIDICGISEHWLFPSNVHFLESLTSRYNVYAKCDNDLTITSPRRVGKGGVALMWNKRLDNYIVPLPIDDDRLIGLQLQLTQTQYMSYSSIFTML